MAQPSPEADGLAQLYSPFKNYLLGSLHIGNQYNILKEQILGAATHYPEGRLLLSWAIAGLGLQKIFLNFPYLLGLLLILPICSIPFFIQSTTREKLYLLLILFFCPVSQISIKQFSLHGFNVLYAFLAILFFRSFLANRSRFQLLGFILSFWIAIVFKHLGLIIFINLFATFLIYSFQKKKVDWELTAAFVFIFAISLPFYTITLQIEYIYESFRHNQSINVLYFFLVAFLVLAITFPFL
ncbi:hypothetical protein MJH12_17435, partial [bacterium]|nr:hypothetical protein [bacterium]